MAKLVSNVYGDALFEEAMEKDALSAWDEEVRALKRIFMENPDMTRFLNHPQIIKEEKIKMLETAFGGRISEELLGFLVIATEKDRQGDLPAIFDHFLDRVREYRKIGVAKVVSAVELSEEQKQSIEKKLPETTPYVSLETEYAVDSGIIGGLVIRIGDRVADSSVRTKLEGMKQDLLKLKLA